NRKKLRSFFDFHRSRIDNPIAVIANEIEPLTTLEKRISRLCWHPPFLLRYRVRKFFIRKALNEFERDYHQYYKPEESKPQRIGRPFLVRGRNRRVGIVLSHGYLAAPEEVRPLAEYLGRRGYWVWVPRLKGHGTAPEDLAQCSYQDWIDSVEQGYLVIRNLCDMVFVGGFSTGAALALELATRIGEIAGVFAISTPLRLQYLSSRFAPMVAAWNRIMDRVHLEEAKMEFVENQPENPHINYHRNPVSGVHELDPPSRGPVHPPCSGWRTPPAAPGEGRGRQEGQMNFLTVLILAAMLADFGLGMAADLLNLKNMGKELPQAFKGWYDPRRYAEARQYLMVRTRLGWAVSGVDLAAVLVFWFAGGFAWLDGWVRGFHWGPIGSGILFIAILLAIKAALDEPFSLYSTFVVEARFGFNKTTWGTYLKDRLKGAALAAVLGGPLLAAVLAFFDGSCPYSTGSRNCPKAPCAMPSPLMHGKSISSWTTFLSWTARNAAPSPMLFLPASDATGALSCSIPS
ncbi:MAG: alpha/beta hydrolase, partial [Desulfosarcinaceae bacterium]